MKTILAVLAIAGGLAAVAHAQPAAGPGAAGWGPMTGSGPGAGVSGGWGPGMMGGWGPGMMGGWSPGMMGGWGPGMMGGWGPGAMGGGGPGAMGGGGPGAMGWGHGMRGGAGAGTMGAWGPGAMHGYGGPGAYAGSGSWPGIELSAEQRKRIGEIREQAAQAQWKTMRAMRRQRAQIADALETPLLDEAAARQAFQTISDARKAMFETSIDTRKRIEAVLTAEQREQIKRRWGD